MIFIALAVVTASLLSAAPTAALAANSTLAQRYRSEIRDDIVNARADLARHHRIAAISATGDAETGLLNAMEAKLYASPSTLTALERAHESLQANNRAGAERQLVLAEQYLLPFENSWRKGA